MSGNAGCRWRSVDLRLACRKPNWFIGGKIIEAPPAAAFGRVPRFREGVEDSLPRDSNRDLRNVPTANGFRVATLEGITHMLKTILAVSATAVLLTACGNSDGADAPVEGPAVSSPESPTNPPIDTQETSEKGALTPGANSFTEGQAKEAIEKQGYTVSGPLTQDEQGIWKAQASRGGASTTVSVDYKGVVTPQ